MNRQVIAVAALVVVAAIFAAAVSSQSPKAQPVASPVCKAPTVSVITSSPAVVEGPPVYGPLEDDEVPPPIQSGGAADLKAATAIGVAAAAGFMLLL